MLSFQVCQSVSLLEFLWFLSLSFYIAISMLCFDKPSKLVIRAKQGYSLWAKARLQKLNTHNSNLADACSTFSLLHIRFCVSLYMVSQKGKDKRAQVGKS